MSAIEFLLTGYLAKAETLPAASIQFVVDEFQTELRRCTNLFLVAQTAQAPSGRKLHIRDIEEFSSLALLKITLAWENFLEDCFLRYLCGVPSLSGTTHQLLVTKCNSIGAAESVLSGGRSYLDWRQRDVISRANRLFAGGGPFLQPIQGSSRLLSDLATLRNRIAHRSNFSRLNFVSVVRSELGYVPPGITPGRLLLTVTPESAPERLFLYYVNCLAAVAGLIAA